MKRVEFKEYQDAKAKVLYGKEYKESTRTDGDTIFKKYATKDGAVFYEVNRDGEIEFWSSIESESRIYSEKTDPVVAKVEKFMARWTAYITMMVRNGETPESICYYNVQKQHELMNIIKK